MVVPEEFVPEVDAAKGNVDWSSAFETVDTGRGTPGSAGTSGRDGEFAIGWRTALRVGDVVCGMP